MTSFKQFLREELRDREFAEGYEEFSAELDFAVQLAARREQLNLTQQKLAEETGIRQPMIARIEHGQMPTAPTLQKLAKALKANFLFTGEVIRLIPVDEKARKQHEKQEEAENYVKTAEIDFAYKEQFSSRSKPYKVNEDETFSFGSRGVRG